MHVKDTQVHPNKSKQNSKKIKLKSNLIKRNVFTTLKNLFLNNWKHSIRYIEQLNIKLNIYYILKLLKPWCSIENWEGIL